MRPAYVTNNASRTPETVAEHLRELGLPAETGDVVTSAQAAATLVADRVPPGSAVLVVGGEGLVAALRERGLTPVQEAGPEVAAVVQGYDPEVGWRQLAEGAYAVATGRAVGRQQHGRHHPDAAGHRAGQRHAGRGGRAHRSDGRRTRSPASPRPRCTGSRCSAPVREHPLVVGDRLDTDIEGANRAGVPSLLVLTGVSRPADLLRAGPELRPTYLAADLESGLMQPHPGVEAEGAAGPAAAGPCRWPEPR